MVFLDIFCNLYGLMGSKTAVHFYKDLYAFAGNGMNRLYQVDGFAILSTGKLQISITKRVELKPQIAPVNHNLRSLSKLLRLALASVPAIGVRRNFIVNFASDKLIHRQVRLLANDVPTGHFDESQ